MFAQLIALLPLLSVAMAAPSSGYEAAPAAPATPEYAAPAPEYAAPAEGGYEGGWSEGGEYKQEGGEYGGGEIVHQTTITQTAESSYYTPQHGSGAETEIVDLNSCLQVCHAKFGGGGIAPPAGTGKGEAPPTGTAPAPEAAGPATHTIIVAPTQGVLRFVPFAVTANPGDTLHYIWGGSNHSVTQSDGQNVCSKSNTEKAFDSGVFNATATFDQIVEFNASTPQFYYCKVGKHCSAGMFGLINPPVSNVSNELTDQATKTSAPIEKSTAGSGGGATCRDNSMDCWIDKWAGGGKRQKQIHDGVKQKCATAPDAWAWGGKWDMSAWETTIVTKEVIIENVMYSRYMFATNPTMLDKTQPFPADWKAPPDLNSFVVDNSAETASLGPAAGASSSASDSAAAATESGEPGQVDAAGAQAAEPSAGGAGRLGVPMALLAGLGVAVGLFI